MSKFYIGVDSYFIRDSETFIFMVFTIEDGITKVIRSGVIKDQYITDSELKFNENCFRYSKYYEDAPIYSRDGMVIKFIIGVAVVSIISYMIGYHECHKKHPDV